MDVAEVALAARGEEALQELGGSCLADAAIDFWRMMAGRLGEEARAMLDGAAFRVWRAEIEPADAGEGDGRGAHGARLERDIEVAIDEPLAAKPGAGLANGEQLGMGGRIVKLKRAVAGAWPAPRLTALTTTAPMGTSPRRPAASASAKARSMGRLLGSSTSASFSLVMGAKLRGSGKQGQGAKPASR